ncbi:MAG: fumarylacetoacetate hydrolase family protein, partial [Pseudomonadota bacterium]
FLSYQHGGTSTWGALTESGAICDLGALMGCDLKGVIEQDRIAEAIAKTADHPADHSLDEIELQLPIPNPGKIICIGVNYANRNAEYKDGSEPPAYPSIFMRTTDSLTTHGNTVWRPPESEQLDYEGEIALVIGKRGRRISEDAAYDHIAGLSIMNEGTIRDWVRHAKFNVTQGKNFVNIGAMGPWMVSADEFTPAQFENMHIRTCINGEERQNDTTANMMFPFKYLISYCSKFFQLAPGDIIATGTPNGAGARFDPPVYLQPGDVVSVEVEGVGELRHGVIDEPL